MNIEQMKRERKGVIDSMRAMLTVAETRDDKALTEDEATKYVELEKDVAHRDEAIAREERLITMEAATAVKAAPTAETKTEKGEFRSIGEFISTAITDPKSSRLEQRTTSLGVQTQAGYLVPPEFDRTLRMVDAEEAIIRPRALVIPSSSESPDATINIPALDQSGSKGVHAGVVMNWVAENGARTTAGDIVVQQISLTPQLISGWMDISNKLIGNYEAITSLAQARMSLAIAAAEETAFMQGTGLGQPTGFIGHPCNTTIARSTTGRISYDDIVNMLSLRLSGFGYVFIAARTAMAQLLLLKDAAGNLIWQPNARDGSPGTLMGIPVLFSERNPTLGAQGDIVLANLQAYAIKDGSPLTLLVDQYTQAGNGITRLYVTWTVDAKPLLTTPIKGEDGVARSAFVTLSSPS